jgi:benzoylformate decarboxylase
VQLADVLIEILLDEGVDRVFGNPGTTELRFVDAIAATPELRYVLAPHEGAVVSMADGYARGTGRTSFVSLHVAAGTANGLIGMLNALRSRTPMVVTAGQQDSRHLIQDPMLSGDVVGLACRRGTIPDAEGLPGCGHAAPGPRVRFRADGHDG